MINPNDVNLILFDLGGTIISDVKPVYEAIRRAFSKLGWEVPFSENGLLKYMGAPSDDFYQLITPADKHSFWKEAREKVRQEYGGAFSEFSSLYPGVTETLVILRKRGYQLALYSKASSGIVTDTITKLGIKDYFVYVKWKDDDKLNKNQLARKIINKFNATAAIVGDSLLDIKAARETGSLSIGVLYGYGGEEPKQADITINSFDELLNIFNSR